MDVPVSVGQTPVPVPVMTPERFCDLTGVSSGVLEGWMNRGYVPVVIIGRRRLINLVKLNAHCAGDDADMVG